MFLSIGERIVEYSCKLSKRFGEQIDSNNIILSEFGIQTKRIEPLTYFGKALYQDEELICDRVINWGGKVAKLRIKNNIPMSKLLRASS